MRNQPEELGRGREEADLSFPSLLLPRLLVSAGNFCVENEQREPSCPGERALALLLLGLRSQRLLRQLFAGPSLTLVLLQFFFVIYMYKHRLFARWAEVPLRAGRGAGGGRQARGADRLEKRSAALALPEAAQSTFRQKWTVGSTAGLGRSGHCFTLTTAMLLPLIPPSPAQAHVASPRASGGVGGGGGGGGA